MGRPGAFGPDAFGQHAFGMPIFSSPQIPTIAPGRLGPAFNLRPAPVGFPGASVMGVQGCAGCNGFGDVVDWLKDAGTAASGIAVDAATAKIREEAGKGAMAVVKPLVIKAMGVSAVAITLSVVALWAAFRKR